MKRRDLQLNGQTSSTGGLLIANKEEMNQFFKLWPSSFFIISIEVTKTKPLSVPLLVYYKKKIVPDMREAYFKSGDRLTLEQTDERLRERSPITTKQNYNFEAKKWETIILNVEDLDTQQLVFFIEQLKDYAAQEFGTWIEDPTSLID
jgi:uncharacterized protein with ParB-like and HNH nuclease domain